MPVFQLLAFTRGFEMSLRDWELNEDQRRFSSLDFILLSVFLCSWELCFEVLSQSSHSAMFISLSLAEMFIPPSLHSGQRRDNMGQDGLRCHTKI